MLICLTLGGMLIYRQTMYKKAQALFDSGDYIAAKAGFEKLGDSIKMAECDYAYTLSRLEKAEQLMEEGKLEEAREEFRLLGDFKNAPELLLECEYRRALKLNQEGNYTQALSIAHEIDAHPGAAALLDETSGHIYRQALGLAYECRLDEAMELFGIIPEYKDSESLYKRCSDRIVRMLSDWEEPVNYAPYAGQDMGTGKLYWHRLGLIYVPDDCNADTTAMIFYPGGYDSSLANNYVTEYLYGVYGELPNSIMLFCHANGYYDMDFKAQDAYNALEQAAMENNVFLHDIALIGASNGAYTACHTAVWLYENAGISAKYVLTLDAGQHWSQHVPVLSTEDCDIAAKTGAKFYLVEGDGVGMNVLAIETMVAHGMDLTIARVRDYGHYSVIYDAMKYGFFHHVMGEGELPQDTNYRYYKLDKNSTYPN